MPAIINIETKYKAINANFAIDCNCRLYASIFRQYAIITNDTPDKNSNMKYLGLIFCLHFLHLPPSNK